MKSPASTRHLALAFYRHRTAQTLVFLVVGLLIGAIVFGLSTYERSARRAISDSVTADLGGRRYALQTTNKAAIHELSTLPHVTAVQDDNGNVEFNRQALPVLIRSTTDPTAHLAFLVSGRYPGHIGDATLSRSVARSLGIGIGDTVLVTAAQNGRQRVRITGLTLDPAQKSTRTLVMVVPDSAADFHPTIWLSKKDFYDTQSLQKFLDRRTATYQSLPVMLDHAQADQPQFVSDLHFLPTGSGLVLGIVLLTICAAFARHWVAYVDTLAAAGMSRNIAWKTMLSTITVAVLAGEAVGAVVSYALLHALRTPVSGWAGQEWARLGLAIPTLVAMLGLTVIVPVVTLLVLRLSVGRKLWIPRTSVPSRRSTWIAGGVLLAAALVMIYSNWASHGAVDRRGSGLAPWMAALVGAAIPFAIPRLLTMGLPQSTKILILHLLSSLRTVSAIVAVIAIGCGTWAASTTYQANLDEAAVSPLEPAGSYVISGIPDLALPTLARTYQSYGGGTIRTYQLPDESKANVRVTSTGLVKCMATRKTLTPDDVPNSCFPQRAASPINIVALGPAGSSPSADRNLIADGRVGLLEFRPNSAAADRVADTHAAPSRVLGGNLPGLVVPTGGSVARAFNLLPSGSSAVLLLDFGSLSQQSQLRIRSAVLRLAPGAQTADGSDPTAYDRLRSVANTVGLLGAAAAMLVLIVAGAALVVAHAPVRRTLVDLGSAASTRNTLVARWIALPLITSGCSLILAYLSATQFGSAERAGHGILWVAPAVAGMIAAVLIAFAFSQVPSSSGD